MAASCGIEEPPVQLSAPGRPVSPLFPRIRFVSPSWPRFLSQFQRDIKLWLFCLGFLSLFRVAFILVFREKIGDSTDRVEVLAALFNGFRFDVRVATYWTALPMLASLMCRFAAWQAAAAQIRWAAACLFALAAPSLCVTSIEYFREFGEPFDHRVFELIYDDVSAICATAVAEYHAIPSGIAALTISGISIALLHRLLKSGFVSDDLIQRHLSSLPRQLLVSVAIIALLAVSARGSLGRRPAQLKDAAITTDAFLNKAVLNPFTALRYAAKTQWGLASSTGLTAYLPDADIAAAARIAFETKGPLGNLDDGMRRTAPGFCHAPPSHIFLIIMESYDAWPLLEKFRALGLTGELQQLADQGLHVRSFLPASGGTMKSFVSIICSFPEVGVHTHCRKTAQSPFPSSLAETFKRLGYRTRFFCGGKLSWQQIGEFAQNQGFQEVCGGTHVGREARSNEWGCDDEHLFQFVLGKLQDDTPSLNVILTSSYHPPFDIDLKTKGFPLTQIPKELEDEIDPDHAEQLVKFGHLWYSDQCLGEFVRRVEQRFPRSLFAMTGDHHGRRYPNSHPTLFEVAAVPLVLYGKRVLENVTLPPNVAGSHIDIGPTLIEIAAPSGFTYHAMGHSLLTQRDRFWGIGGRGRIITHQALVETRDLSRLHPVPDSPLELDDVDVDPYELKRMHDAVHGVGWWRIMRGPNLPSPIIAETIAPEGLQTRSP